MHKRTRRATFLFLIILPAFFGRASAQNLSPVIEHCNPSSVSVNSVLQCEGFRLGAESIDPEKVKAIFSRGDLRATGRISGSEFVTNDTQKGAQSLDVIVPEEITRGRWQLIVEVRGRSSEQVAIEIGEWTPPSLSSLRPEKVSHGEVVWLDGSNLHNNDDIEITDSLGRVRRLTAGQSSSWTALTVPLNMAEGEASVRVGLASRNLFSEPLKFVVTSDPIALDLWADGMSKVAPGQWTNIVATNLKPLEGADSVEVEFKQGEQVIIQPTLKPDSVHVQVPAALKAGSVELRTRTVRQGLTSEWSKSISYEVLERPAAPFVGAIELGDKGQPVFLWEGPERPTSFEVQPGYALTLRGNFPARGPQDIRVSFQGVREQFSLTPVEGEREGLLLNLPLDLKTGDWKLSISDLESGITESIPVIMHVK